MLHHGRGTDERDLLPLADALDPARSLLVVSVRGPLRIAGSPGYHWYLVPRVGDPDPQTFRAAFVALAELHDELWARSGKGPEQTVLAGFSMGAVMSYALGLAHERPPVAGILAFSGFISAVSGFAPSFAEHTETRAFVAHGDRDPVIDVSFARAARDMLRAGGLEVSYHESAVGHQLDPASVAAAAGWLGPTLNARHD